MLDDIKKTLWASADKLRANMDAAVQLVLEQAQSLGEDWNLEIQSNAF